MMAEIQCPSCQTRYRVDDRALPDETPTFKCSRCGHVFAAEPRRPKSAIPAAMKPKPVTPRAERPGPVARPSADAASGSAAPKDFVPNESTRKEAPFREVVTRGQPDSVAANPSATGTRKPAAEAPAKWPAEPAAAAPARGGNLLGRLFQAGAAEGENLSFDFHEEKPGSELEAEFKEKVGDDEWQVGDTAGGLGGTPDVGEEPGLHAMSPAQALLRRAAAAKAAADATIEPDPSVAFLYKNGKVHKAGFFIGLFFLVLFAFGLFSLIICGAPMASAEFLSAIPGIGDRFVPPVMPARLVALTEVHTAYQRLKSGRFALVISGNAENVGNAPLHAVQIEASLLTDAQNPLKTQSVYCGNSLSAEMVGEMTPRELEFFQKLEPPKNFVLPPTQSSKFTLVIIDPPPGVTRFQVSVLKAQPATDGSATAGA